MLCLRCNGGAVTCIRRYGSKSEVVCARSFLHAFPHMLNSDFRILSRVLEQNETSNNQQQLHKEIVQTVRDLHFVQYESRISIRGQNQKSQV